MINLVYEKKVGVIIKEKLKQLYKLSDYFKLFTIYMIAHNLTFDMKYWIVLSSPTTLIDNLTKDIMTTSNDMLILLYILLFLANIALIIMFIILIISLFTSLYFYNISKKNKN